GGRRGVPRETNRLTSRSRRECCAYVPALSRAVAIAWHSRTRPPPTRCRRSCEFALRSGLGGRRTRKAGDRCLHAWPPAFAFSFLRGQQVGGVDLGRYGSKSLASPCLYAAGLQATGGHPAATRRIGDDRPCVWLRVKNWELDLGHTPRLLAAAATGQEPMDAAC